MKAKISKSEVMKRAWYLFKNQDVKTDAMFSFCLKKSWQISKGNNFNINDLYKRYYSEIYSFINFKLNNNIEVSQEIANDVFIKLHTDMHLFNPELSQIKTWLFNIAKNAVIDYVRKQKNNNTVSMSNYTDNETGKEYLQIVADDNINDDIENSEKSEQIRTIINKVLTEKQRKVAELYFINGYSYKEVSVELEISESDVKVTIFRVRKVLQVAMTENKLYSVR